MTFPILSWKCSSYVEGTEGPEDYLYRYNGEIQATNESETRACLGKFRAYYVDVDRTVNEGFSVFDVLDTESQAHEYHHAIFGSNCPDFSDDVQHLIGFDILGSNLLILDRLELLPEHRGKDLGLKVMAHIINRFSQGAGLVAIKPFPLQLENSNSTDDTWKLQLRLEQYADEQTPSTKKLIDHYSRLGFLTLQDSPFMVLGTSKVLPNIEERFKH